MTHFVSNRLTYTFDVSGGWTLRSLIRVHAVLLALFISFSLDKTIFRWDFPAGYGG